MTGARVVIAAVVVALGVSACSGEDPEPKVAPPPETSAPSDPSTSPETSAPSNAGSSTRNEQAAFVDLYFATISASLSTGDAQAFLDMSAPTCVNCIRLGDNLRAAYADGGHVEGAMWTLDSAEFAKSAPLGDVWNAEVRTTREQWFDSAGELVKTVKASRQHFGLALEPSGDGWRVRELRVSS